MLKKTLLVLAATVGAAAVAHAQSAIETLPSGVRIEHLVRGTGPMPSNNSNVTVHYRGTLVATGAEFDSSYSRNPPATFNLRQVVPCWTEGIPHVAVGGRAVLVCPSRTAYGSRGAGEIIPPNADLRFEVELLGIR